MALNKLKDDQFGNGGISYWKIVESNINWLSRSSHISLAGYTTKQARLDGKQPMETKSFDWSKDEFPFDLATLDEAGENVIKVSYEKIKESKLNEEGVETNFFVDAKDC